MKNIIKTLKEQNYEIVVFNENLNESILQANFKYYKILIKKNKNQTKPYVLRIALDKYFDRWANSGMNYFYQTEAEIIHHLKDKRKCCVDALTEYLYDILEDCEYENNYSKLDETINFLDKIIYEEEN